MTPLLSLDGVHVARAGRPVLAGVTLTLHPGERIALTGPNGAGKTTLLRTLVGLEKITAGRYVAFGTEPKREADFRPVRVRAAFLFQDPDDQLFCPTVLDDVAFGPLNLGLSRAAAEARARDVLARLHLDALASRITWRLSGGEKRLVALAAILAMEPEVLLLDEPTNALDAPHQERLTEILAGLPAAMLIVSHDAGFLARLATRTLALEGGRIVPAAIHSHRLPHIHAFGDAPHGHGAADQKGSARDLTSPTRE